MPKNQPSKRCGRCEVTERWRNARVALFPHNALADKLINPWTRCCMK